MAQLWDCGYAQGDVALGRAHLLVDAKAKERQHVPHQKLPILHLYYENRVITTQPYNSLHPNVVESRFTMNMYSNHY